MGKFRIQPKDIEISEKEPFENDRLGRRKMIESLTNLVGTIEGPCVIAVDAPWGAGKTTFLRMWSQHLRNQKFPVVEFNAWETDFSDDPFVALCAEMMGSIDAEESNELAGKIDEVKEKGQVVIRHFVSNAVKQATLGFVDYNAVKADMDKQPDEPHIQQRMDEYQETQAALRQFRQALKDMAAELPGSKPLMVMIDELDRCRPTYAVELLETAKHLFSVDQVVFVLAVNRAELQHAVKALYGNEFKADGYMRRFIDLDVHLPEPYLENFMNELLDSMGLKDDYWFEKLLKSFFRASSPPPRDIAQTVHRLGLVLNSMPDRNNSVARMTAIALIMRIIDEEHYHQFAQRGISDLDLADKIFSPSSTPSITHWRWIEEGVIFQTGICLAYRQFINQYEKTPLEIEIQRRIDDEEDGMVNGALQNGRSIARNALEYTDSSTPLFLSAYEHIELMFSLTETPQ